jgi:hypothetical protein
MQSKLIAMFHNLCSFMQRDATHAKRNRRLVRILGKISSDMYPTNKNPGTDWILTAQQITAELKAWKESLPPFLEPEKVDPTMLIAIFQRQSTVLRLAYLNALILANRPSLLSNFADLTRSQNPPSGELESSLKECIDAASAVVETVNGFIGKDAEAVLVYPLYFFLCYFYPLRLCHSAKSNWRATRVGQYCKQRVSATF